MWFRSEIEECPDQDTSKMQAKLSLVPIDQLSLFIGKKVRPLTMTTVDPASDMPAEKHVHLLLA